MLWTEQVKLIHNFTINKGWKWNIQLWFSMWRKMWKWKIIPISQSGNLFFWGIHRPLTKNQIFLLPHRIPAGCATSLRAPWEAELYRKGSGARSRAFTARTSNWSSSSSRGEYTKGFVFASACLSSLLVLLNHQAVFIQLTNNWAV